MAVTMVALELVVSICAWCSKGRSNPRSSRAQAEQQPREQQLWIDVLRRHEDPQAHADDGVSYDGDAADAYAVAQQAPDRTCNQCHQLVREAQGAHRVAHMMRLSNALRHHKRNGAVQEDEERDGEQCHPKEICCDLRARRRKAEHAGQRRNAQLPRACCV